MVKVFLSIIAVLVLLCNFAYADIETCLVVWSTDVGGTDGDTSDSVWCDGDNDGLYNNVGATKTFEGNGNPDVTIAWDTATWDGSTAVSTILGDGLESGETDVTPCTNQNSFDLYVAGGATEGQLSTGGVYYYTKSSLADGDKNSFGLNPPAFFQLLVKDNDETGTGCMAVWVKIVR